MINLRAMRADEFPGFADYFIPDYAQDISTHQDVDLETARTRAENALREDLPQGPDTPGQSVMCIVQKGDAEETPVGYLWCKADEDGPSVFIYDFYIFPAHRGKGFAKAALSALEQMFGASGHSEVKLRVAADNTPAQQLYLAAGFHVTGWNMRKTFGDGGAKPHSS